MAATKLKRKTWVLVADGEKALFLRNDGDAKFPNLDVVREVHDDNPPSRQQGTDRPGRLHDDTGDTHHVSAVQETDWHRIEKVRFADEIADRLYKMAHRGAFDDIIIAAPPLVLGELRKKMHKEVLERVVAEVPKTLTGHTVPQIEEIIREA